MKNCIVLLVMILLPAWVVSQKIATGKVVEQTKVNGKVKELPVPGVYVFWADGSGKVLTDSSGRFKIGEPKSLPANLIFKFVGYSDDTLLVNRLPLKNTKVTLTDVDALGAVIVEGGGGRLISIESPWNKEILTTGEFKVAACCNVSEVFESNASVDVNFSDAVSGAKSIQLLGLDGVYAQIMLENIPFIRGLESRYGLTTMPGPWLESIQITKGSGSVTNGYESLTGQLNIEYIKPDQEGLDRWSLNLFANHMGRTEGNFHVLHEFSDKLYSMLMGHGMYLGVQNDHNHDGFLDMPLSKRGGLLNRWRYINDKVEGHVMAGFMIQDNTGGQATVSHAGHQVTGPIYNIGVTTNQYYASIKNGFLLPKTKHASIGLVGHWKHYDQTSNFGNTTYIGSQEHAYMNIIYQDIIGHSFHNISTGMSTVYDEMAESLDDSSWQRQELVPGAFFEYNYKDGVRKSFVLGVRGDYNAFFNKFWFTPRVHLKYFITEDLAFRIGGGRSYRTPNAISENIAVLASARKVIVEENIQYEEAWNIGGSITWDFELKDREGTIRLDGYRSSFINQLIVDRDASAREVRFYNLQGRSYANVMQVDFNYSPAKWLNLTTAYKWSDVWATYGNRLRRVPLIPEHRVLFTAGFHDPKKIWRFDFTVNWFGPRRIPDLKENPDQFDLPNDSEAYWMINAQLTKAFRRFELYLGGENLLNFQQEQAILSAESPFGTYFDASNIWGPVNGRVFYIGFRTKFM